jgi:folate-binding protein YgfZ
MLAKPSALAKLMTEAVEQIIPRQSALADTHARLGAIMVEQAGWSIPANYGDVLFEYAAVRERGAGLSDLSPRGRILVSGSEAIQFLNGLITNDMKTLAVNSWMPAAFPNVQGRLIASVRVVRLQDEGTGKNLSATFLLDTEAATHAQVLKTIERYTLAGDFRVSDLTNQTALLSVRGHQVAEIMRARFGDETAALETRQALQTGQDQGGGALTIMRLSPAADGFEIVTSSAQATAIWDGLQDAGARPVGYEALEIFRIEAGLPRYGIDMDDSNVVSETNLDDAVSFTKGCYVGQEIIARIKYRGHVAKKLTGLVFECAERVAPDAVIKALEGKEVGRITSVTYSPQLGRTIALGYLKFDYLEPGTSVRVSAGDQEILARVATLPFLPQHAQLA